MMMMRLVLVSFAADFGRIEFAHRGDGDGVVVVVVVVVAPTRRHES